MLGGTAGVILIGLQAPRGTRQGVAWCRIAFPPGFAARSGSACRGDPQLRAPGPSCGNSAHRVLHRPGAAPFSRGRCWRSRWTSKTARSSVRRSMRCHARASGRAIWTRRFSNRREDSRPPSASLEPWSWLIDALRHFSDLATVGTAVGTAFVSTLYGLALANLLLLPAAHRIRSASEDDAQAGELIAEGCLGIYDSVHPTMLRERLRGFLRHPFPDREKLRPGVGKITHSDGIAGWSAISMC